VRPRVRHRRSRLSVSEGIPLGTLDPEIVRKQAEVIDKKKTKL